MFSNIFSSFKKKKEMNNTENSPTKIVPAALKKLFFMCMLKPDHANVDEMKIRISGVDSVLFKLLNHGRHGCFVLHVERDFSRFGTGADIDAGTSIPFPIT